MCSVSDVLKRCRFLPAVTLIIISLLLVGCSLFGGSESQGKKDNNPTSVPTAAPVALTKLHWCNNKSSQVFIDGRAQSTPAPVAGKGPAQPVNLGPANGTPVPINDWNTLKANLGFTVFLPETLPTGSCLLNASGTVRNAVIGSNFVLTYMLPDEESLTISQAPQHTTNKTLQCGVSDTSTQNSGGSGGTPTPMAASSALPLQVCSGVRDTTNITFSARWKIDALRQFFESLKPNVDWIPAT